MTQTKIPLDLDPAADRFLNLDFDEWMREVADTHAQELADHFPGRYGDIENCHPSLLPFYAWAYDAVAWTPIFGIRRERQSISVAREMNRVMGTPLAWYLFVESFDGAGSYTLTNNAAGTPIAVDLYISPPLGFDVTPEFIAHITHVANAGMLPYWLRLAGVHILNRFTVTVHHYSAFSDFAGTLVIDLGG